MPMPGFISKGPILKKLDDLSQNPAKLNDFLKDLQEQGPNRLDLVSIATKHGMAKDTNKSTFVKYGPMGEAEHLHEHWFGVGGKAVWWPLLQSIEPIMRAGLIKAIELATQDPRRPLPIDSYWICSSTVFEVAVTASTEQVTLIILSPQPDDRVRVDELIDPEPVWVVKRGGAAAGEDVEKQEGDIFTVRPRTRFAP